MQHSGNYFVGTHRTLKVWVFSIIFKIPYFWWFITPPIEKLRLLFVVIQNTLSFVFRTKWPLKNIWLLRYKQHNWISILGQESDICVTLDSVPQYLEPVEMRPQSWYILQWFESISSSGRNFLGHSFRSTLFRRCSS